MTEFREMFIKRLVCSPKDGQPVVLLKEKNGTRILPIWIGAGEFIAIISVIERWASSRPQTHDLLCNALAACGRKVSQLAITKIEESTFFAELSLTGKGRKDKILDCRPSDGIALALRHGAKIVVAEAVLEQAGYEEEQVKMDDETQAFSEFVQNIKASDFNKLAPSKELPEDSPASCPDGKEAGESSAEKNQGGTE